MSFSVIEDLVVAAARRQGVQPDASAMMQAALDLAGSSVVDGAFILANRSLLPRDYVASLRASMPDAFKPVGGHVPDPATVPTGNLTLDMSRKVRALRSQKLPSDWDHVRKQVVGKTAEMMDRISASRQAQ
jgi:hypothetical protein